MGNTQVKQNADIETGDGSLAITKKTDKKETPSTTTSSILLPSPAATQAPTNSSSLSTRQNESLDSRNWEDQNDHQNRGKKYIQQAINMAGNDSFGIMAVDLWILDEKDGGKLHHFGDSSLNWLNHIYRKQLEDEHNIDALDALYELDHDITVEHEISGAGLAGNLWQMYGASAGSSSNLNQQLVWHDLREFTTNPFQMPSARLQALGKIFGKTAGIPFNIMGRFKGVVVYFARQNFDEAGVNSKINNSFLNFSAQQIGSAAAMVEARTRSIEMRKERVAQVVRRVRFRIKMVNVLNKLPTDKALNAQNDSFVENKGAREEKRSSSMIVMIQRYARVIKIRSQELQRVLEHKRKNLVKKSLKPPLKPPPSTSFYIAAWTMMVCFIAFTVILGLNEFVKSVDDDFGIVLGPFGALITLQYALTAAPPSQPSNALFGMITCLVVPMSTKYLLHDLGGLPQWIVASFGTSLAIGVMCKTAIVHPPAGATAIVFAMSKKSFKTEAVLAGIMIAVDLVAIAMAMLMNNLSDTRQYPMYPMWHLGVPPKSFDKEK